MVWIIGLLSACVVLLLIRLAFLRGELGKLGEQARELKERSRYGARLHSESGDRALTELAGAVNSLVDAYEGRIGRAERAEENIRLSISGISHDLRTPLTALSGYLQLLGKTNAAPQRAEYTAATEDAARTLSDLVENFYDLSRLELGDDIFSRRDTELASFVCERFLAFYENFAERGLTASIRGADRAYHVVADPLALTRVLNNLIQNLLRYASGEISVSFADEGEYAAVIVGNETKGPLPDETEKIFERFFTADPSRSNRGSGLGLYISRKLVEGMGGRIGAEKQNGDALVLTIRLPKVSP
ncbi:MAG: HAMP domain-containing histidine kinase [Clostridiales Family XIII bacterium]|jgi:signal transduction histidine kinase|nr:HAMP domain-containing histidine kinase [Clostridiales Family XIII bacterium]